MSYTATISGLKITGLPAQVTAFDLLRRLLQVTGTPRAVGNYYYLPRQNKPYGAAGDGNYQFDLRECSDFILVPALGFNLDRSVTEKEHSRLVEESRKRINLYNKYPATSK